MPNNITINTISGATPYDIYLCDSPITTCIYIATISSVPYTFQVPVLLESQTSFNLKMVDNNNCQAITPLTLP